MPRPRRKAEEISPVRRSYILSLIKKVDEQHYGHAPIKRNPHERALTPEEQKMRNKALIALLYLSGRRISELVGRTYVFPDGRVDVWEGVYTSDFSFKRVAEENVLAMRYRVLKRRSKIEEAEAHLRLADPLTKYVLDWIAYLKEKYGEDIKLFQITRQRAWQIVTELDPNVWLHWFRHQRLTHAASVMSPYELKQFGRFARLETAMNYVHTSPARQLQALSEADRQWE